MHLHTSCKSQNDRGLRRNIALADHAYASCKRRNGEMNKYSLFMHGYTAVIMTKTYKHGSRIGKGVGLVSRRSPQQIFSFCSASSLAVVEEKKSHEVSNCLSGCYRTSGLTFPHKRPKRPPQSVILNILSMNIGSTRREVTVFRPSSMATEKHCREQ